MFENNSLIHRGNGALIENMNYKESVRIINCEFLHNVMGNSTSGSIFIDSHGLVKILSNKFVQNSGKVVDVRSFNQTTIDQNSFMDNTGPGAALDINAKAGPLVFKRNHFTNNADGAVDLLVSGSVAVTVGNCSFSSNTKLESGNGGAAITLFRLMMIMIVGTRVLVLLYKFHRVDSTIIQLWVSIALEVQFISE